MVPIPEGQAIVRCPYCELRSLVHSERGVYRYQAPLRIPREQAQEAMRRFLGSHRAISGDARRSAQISESFLAYLPFWTAWARAVGWVFGQEKVGSGDDSHYEPREVRVAQEMSWNSAACDVGEFGVNTVPLANQPLEPFDSASLHESGMVFEPTGSAKEAGVQALEAFQERVRQAARLDRVAQVFARFTRHRLGLVYYPLWVMRYLYRGRAFQVVVDGCSGQTLYGKAPGDTFYRAARLVGGMALGAFLGVDGSALSFYIASQSEGDTVGTMIAVGLGALAVGFVIMAAAFRAFRYGEQFEYRYGKSGVNLFDAGEIMTQFKDVDKWIKRLS
jgi:hypothetical protein